MTRYRRGATAHHWARELLPTQRLRRIRVELGGLKFSSVRARSAEEDAGQDRRPMTRRFVTRVTCPYNHAEKGAVRICDAKLGGLYIHENAYR
jgi:hypothetical protein